MQGVRKAVAGLCLMAGTAVSAAGGEQEQLQLLAERGVESAQYRLADSYYRGEGLPRDPAAAYLWYRRAAEQGHMMAQYLVGVMLAGGEGIEADVAEAYAWMTLVAARGDSHAEQLRRSYRDRLTPAQRGRAEALAGRLQVWLLH